MIILAFGMPAAPEWIFIGILALVLFGPKKLPELAKGLGKALGEIQKAKEDFHREITGVPPLPKIEPPQGLQPAVSEPSSSVQDATTEALGIPPKEGEGKASKEEKKD
jgi:sec-independent protein translocase protein TatA